LSAGAMFINRVLFPDDVAGCRRCEQARRWQDATLARLADTCADKTLYVARNFPAEIAGRRALGSFTGELWRLK